MIHAFYRKKRCFLGFYPLRIIIFFLIALWTFPLPLLAQSQRRGVFLQDEDPSMGGAGNFEVMGEEVYPGGMSGDSGSTGMDPFRRSGVRTLEAPSGGNLIYQIHVLGEVRRPGTYKVSPSMRVTDALRLAGGIENNGSERFIEIRRGGQGQRQVVDLFAYNTLGEVSQNPYLQDNVAIFVPLKKMAVEIEGPVRRPGIYELRNEQSLEDLVKLAGGFTVGVGADYPLKVIRYQGIDQKQVIEVDDDASQMKSFMLRDGDVVVVEHKFLTKHSFDYNLKKLPNDNIFYPAYENKVFVIGAVRGPGAFPFNQYYNLRQYLTLAGGTTTMAKRGKISVVTIEGKNYKAKNGEYDGVINPGDTIVVPEKSIPTSFYIGLLPTIASLGLSAAALFR